MLNTHTLTLSHTHSPTFALTHNHFTFKNKKLTEHTYNMCKPIGKVCHFPREKNSDFLWLAHDATVSQVCNALIKFSALMSDKSHLLFSLDVFSHFHHIFS